MPRLTAFTKGARSLFAGPVRQSGTRESAYHTKFDYSAPPLPDQQGPHGAVIPPNPNWNIKINNGWVPLPSDASRSK